MTPFVAEPLPEPIFAETVTDIDGADPGEIELEGNGSVLRARRGGAYALDTSLELEWLLTRRFGLRLEPTLSRDDGTLAPAQNAFGVSGGASFKLLRDVPRELYADVEVLARYPWEETPIVQPGDPALPLAFDLRAGLREGPLTLRGSAGVGAFGAIAHVPLRASFAALFPFGASGRFGFWGLEVDCDGARQAPFVAALDLVPDVIPAKVLPLRIGLAVPWAIGERDDRPSLGIFVRIFYESERETAFARGGGT
jgi:hypothetical protein